MRVWRMLALLGFAFGVGGMSWGYAQQQKAVGLVELRIYTAKPGKRDALAARFGQYTTKLYERHGITNVGYFLAASDEASCDVSGSNTFVYMRGYPSAAARDERIKAAHDDPEFARIVMAQERNPETALIEKTRQIDLVPTDYSAIKILK